MRPEEIFEEIAKERDYQKKAWGVRQPDGTLKEVDKQPEAFVLYMEDYLGQARQQLSRENTDDNALESILKVVALGVACLEQHGIPPRKQRPLQVINKRDGKLA